MDYIKLSSIRYGQIVKYWLYIGKKYHYTRHNIKMEKTYKGIVTQHSKKRIEKAVNILLLISPVKNIYNPVSGKYFNFKINFITLTFHKKNIDHEFAYSYLLKPFIRWMREKYHVKNYIWKAELQERGTLHYHITTNTFIHYKDIRSKWNELQNKYNLLDDYYNKFHNSDPNSTDVHSVINIKNLGGYIMKYISKQSGKINGKVWDCSNNLKKNKYYTMDAINDNLMMKLYENDYCEIFNYNNPEKMDDVMIHDEDKIEFMKWKDKVYSDET